LLCLREDVRHCGDARKSLAEREVSIDEIIGEHQQNGRVVERLPILPLVTM